MKTTKEKIDDLLGISDEKPLDEVLNDLDKESNQIKQTFNTITDEVKEDLQKVDEKLGLIKADGSSESILMIKDIDQSMKHVEKMINLSEEVYQHICEGIQSTELLDSELIHSAAAFLESIHVNLQEFISLYRDKQKFIEKVKLMAYQQQQRIELLNLKHKLDMERDLAKQSNQNENTIDATGQTFEYSQEKISKLLENMDIKDIMENNNKEKE